MSKANLVRCLYRVLLSSVLLLLSFRAGGTPNPVLPEVDSSGIFRFGGEYYLMGASGILYSSDNLVDWRGRTKPFNMQNQWTQGLSNEDIASYDLHHHDGMFHLYWCMGNSEELSEARAIGHAIAPEPLGPFTEPARNMPFDRRFDPHFFLDDDGRCYFYKVRTSPEQAIWGEPMQNPWMLSGFTEALLQTRLDPESVSRTPDTEPAVSPWVVNHHGVYYLLYAVPGGAVRAAQADQPLGFSADKRYSANVFEERIAEAEAKDSEDNSGEETEGPGKDSVTNIKRPRLIRGPNGFEWWFLYTASFDGKPSPSLGIQRAHFFGRRLVIEEPGVEYPEAYLSVPAKPGFCDTFDIGEYLRLIWSQPTGQWRIDDGIAKQMVKTGLCVALLEEADSKEFLFETTFRFIEGGTGQAGVIVWRRNERNEIRVGFDRAQRDWVLTLLINNREQVRPLYLGRSSNPDGWHRIRVENNIQSLAVIVDGTRIDLDVSPNMPGKTGFYTKDASATFGMPNYTRGWEEYGKAINGWENALSGEEARGEQRISPDGLQIVPVEGGRAQAFKGNPLDNYEFAFQLLPGTSSSGSVHSGAYAVWADKDNYLEAAIDAAGQKLIVSGLHSGKKLKEETVALPDPSPRWNPSPTLNGRHLRVVKQGDKVHLFVDGRLLHTSEGAWPASQAGLFTEGAMCRFDGISRFELGQDIAAN